MECPFCQTDNREDRETCYVCGKDISTVRLVVNKSRQHYNDALEHAERGRVVEAVDELKHALDLDAGLVQAHVVLGTLYARQGKFTEARECWKNALAIDPDMARAHDYLERVESVQAVLPTLKTYRSFAILLLLVTVGLAVVLIYALRPDPGAAALATANQLIEQGRYGAAVDKLETALILTRPGSPVASAAAALRNTVRFDLHQQVRIIQDLKYRQLFPEALEAIAKLEASGPDPETSAALATVKSDISYYYHNLIAQLYIAYEQGDLEFEPLRDEITRYISLYPGSPDREEILGYLESAERLEVHTAMDELRRRFALDNDVEAAVEDLQELAPRYATVPSFQVEREAFIEELLSYQFNVFTGYLETEEFVRASSLLNDIERISTEFDDVVGDISGAIDLAGRVLRDARRQHQLDQIEQLITKDNLLAAEDAVYEMLQEADLSNAELGLLRSYWRRINRREGIEEFYSSRPADMDYFQKKISDEQASQTLRLYEETIDMPLPHRQRVHLLGLAAASALRLGDTDRATSFSVTLRKLDANSTVTRAVRSMIRKQVETEIMPQPSPSPPRSGIRIEPVNPRDTDR